MTKPELRSGAGLVRIWTELGATQQYYPLVHTAFWVEHRLFGDATPGYHVISISAARRLRAAPGRDSAPAGRTRRLARGMAVRSASRDGRISGVDNGAEEHAVRRVFPGRGVRVFDLRPHPRAEALHRRLATFSCGLLAKSAIVTLPGALLVVLWWMRGRIGWRRDVLPLLPWLAIGTTSGLLTAWIERRFIGAVGREFDLAVVDRFLIAGRAIGFYVSKLLFPAELVFIYPRWNLDTKTAWQYLFPVAVLVVAVIFYRLRGRSRAPLAALLYFAITLVPGARFLQHLSLPIFVRRRSFPVSRGDRAAGRRRGRHHTRNRSPGRSRSRRGPAADSCGAAGGAVLVVLAAERDVCRRRDAVRNDDCSEPRMLDGSLQPRHLAGQGGAIRRGQSALPEDAGAEARSRQGAHQPRHRAGQNGRRRRRAWRIIARRLRDQSQLGRGALQPRLRARAAGTGDRGGRKLSKGVGDRAQSCRRPQQSRPVCSRDMGRADDAVAHYNKAPADQAG